MLPFLGALVFFTAALVVDDKRVAVIVFFVGLVCWTVFVQDHMSGRGRRK